MPSSSGMARTTSASSSFRSSMPAVACRDARTQRICLRYFERPAFREEFQSRLDRLRAAGTSATTRISRAVLIPEPPSGIEITDKNTLSFNAVMQKRKAEIQELYANRNGKQFF